MIVCIIPTPTPTPTNMNQNQQLIAEILREIKLMRTELKELSSQNDKLRYRFENLEDENKKMLREIDDLKWKNR